MAAAKQKKTNTTKKSGGSSGSRSRKAPPRRPIRREIGGSVLLLLALCVAVSYFGVQAIFVDWAALLLRGLLGYGYWLAAPALVLAGCILLFHRGRPVQLRVTCALLLPVLLGSLGHMLLCKEGFRSSLAILRDLWIAGVEMRAGGALSGALAEGFVAVLSLLPSVILFLVLLVLLAAVALWPALAVLSERHRNRPMYQEPPAQPRQEPAARPAAQRQREQPRPSIDIPLGGETPVPPRREPGRFTGFFRHKSDQQRTPAQVLTEEGTAQPAKTVAIPPREAVSATFREEPAPRPIPVDPMETAAPAERVPEEPAPAPAVREPAEPARREKASTAREVAAQTAAVTAEIEEKLADREETYQYPPVTLLEAGREENYTEAGAELRNNSRRLAETLTSFGVDATPGDVVHGPSVTRYEFVLDQGVKLSKITNLSDDIALALGATGVRIAPIPDKISVVGIEVPNKQVTPVLIRDVLASRDFTEHKSKVAFALGRDIGGNNVIGDIAKLPHVLIAGTTGSGKSVCTNSLIVSMLYKSTPDEVRFIMVDPKMVELAPYNGIPHLLIPVVTDPKKAAGALQWAVFEMMKRYKTFSEHGVKKLEEFNRLARAREDLETLPSVVVVIDELADLMLVAAKEVEDRPDEGQHSQPDRLCGGVLSGVPHHSG